MKRTAIVPGLLLIEDDEDCVFLTRRLLRKAGVALSLVVLHTGAEAIAHLRSTCLAAGGRRGMKPRAVLLDLNLPGALNGFRVLEWARARAAFRGVRFVVLSTSDDPRDRIRAEQLGADAYLTKYPLPHELLAALGPALAAPRRQTETARPPGRPPDRSA